MKSYYKIGEISKIYGIGKDSLMYYEELGILRPKRDENGYRLYHISDIWRLNLIKELRQLDFSMKRIKNYLDTRTLQHTEQIFEEEVNLIDAQIEALLKHRYNIVNRLANIQEVKHKKYHTIEIKMIAERKALILNADITRDADVDFLIQKLQKEHEHQINVLGNKRIGAVFHDEYLKMGVCNRFESIFCLLDCEDVDYNFLLKSGKYVTYTYTGAYKENSHYITQMMHYIEENGYKVVDKVLEIYHVDVHETSHEDEFVTEIQIPIN